MNKVYLLIGGNLGDRFDFLSQVKLKIQKHVGNIIQESSIYESTPWGFDSENDFLNQVIIILTKLSPKGVLDFCLKIENDLGRKRQSVNYSSRTMDIDILFYNDEIFNEPDLIIPHKNLHKRLFTLIPLVELSPDFIHPGLKENLSELMGKCDDKSEARKLKL